MYGIYNKTKNYTLVLINRSLSHTFRKMYIEIHKDEFTDEQYLLSQYSPFHPDAVSSLVSYNKELHWDSPKICVTRNPYHRMLSSFYLFCKKRTLTSYYADNIRFPQLKFANELFDKNYSVLNFENFLEFLSKLNHNESHFLKQSFNIERFDNNMTVTKLSTAKEAMTEFYMKLGYSEDIYNTISKSLDTVYHISGEKTYYSEKRPYTLMSDVQLFNMEFLPDLRNMLTPKTEEMIYNYYKDDFELFGYNRYNISE